MGPWLISLADRIAKLYDNTPVGHAARLNGLGQIEARALCGLLRERLGALWDVMVVVNTPEADSEVRLDIAIERRNDKSKSRLFIVPSDFVAEAAASLADTEVHEVTEHLRPITNTLVRRLPQAVRGIVEEAMKRTPSSARLDFLSALSDTPTLADCGRELWRLGLIPDLDPKIERLPQNRECVAKLTNLLEAGGSVHHRVEATGLGDTELKEHLVEVLRRF